VVGDSVWDLLAGRKGALGVGLLSGGYAMRSCIAQERPHLRRPDDMLLHLEQLGLPANSESAFIES